MADGLPGDGGLLSVLGVASGEGFGGGFGDGLGEELAMDVVDGGGVVPADTPWPLEHAVMAIQRTTTSLIFQIER